MRWLLSAFVCILFFVNSAIADERKTVFEGFDAEIVSIVDDMTDKKAGAIFLDFDFGPIYMGIYGHDNFFIWARKDDLHFAFDGEHLIRVEKTKPYSLKTLSKINALKPTNAAEAESVIKSLVKGEEVKIRYYKWPQHEKVDLKIRNPNLAFIYNKASKQFGWKDFGIPANFAPAKLRNHRTGSDSNGWALLTVIGNRDLGLTRGDVKYGEGSYIRVGGYSLFGIQKGKWCCSTVDWNGKNRIIIRNSKGKIVFKGKVPSTSSTPGKANRWPLGPKAAKAAWNSAPLGSIEIDDPDYGKKVFLYGFKELWKWGVANAGFPALE